MSELMVRLEKLRFIAEELRLAFALSRSAPDAWNARLLARHVLIRASDFIEHARRARRLVRAHGSDRDFHVAKETYAGWFDEYFKAARDRLGAHVQDIDFGRRIELWNDVEISKIGVFVDGAAQIYGDLAALNLPGYVPMASTLAEMADPSFLTALADYRQSAGPAKPEFAHDALGPTRPGTLSGSGVTPVHERASQLSLIARWIDWDMAMLDRFSAFPEVRRILSSRLVTDVVSFADCLITRPVAANAPQAMDGLDELLSSDGDASAALAAFLAGYRFEALWTVSARFGTKWADTWSRTPPRPCRTSFRGLMRSIFRPCGPLPWPCAALSMPLAANASTCRSTAPTARGYAAGFRTSVTRS